MPEYLAELMMCDRGTFCRVAACTTYHPLSVYLLPERWMLAPPAATPPSSWVRPAKQRKVALLAKDHIILGLYA